MFNRFAYLIDGDTPRDTQLAPIYRKSVAYYCLKDDLPVVVTNIIDTLAKDKDEIVKKHGMPAQNDIKNVIAKLSKIKYEIQTDKKFLPFEEKDPDLEQWNCYLESLPEGRKTFYGATWLDAECYLYRKIFVFFSTTAKLKQYDYFGKAKQAKVGKLMSVFNFLADHVATLPETQEGLSYFFQLNIWSHIIEAEFLTKAPGTQPKESIAATITSLMERSEYLLIDDVEEVLSCLRVGRATRKSQTVVHIVLEDCGIQLFSSFLLANFLIEKELATNVHFHPKAYPYRTTEATAKDLDWFVDYLIKSKMDPVSGFAKTWWGYFKNGTFKNCKNEFFWTTPYPYFRMAEEGSDLYSALSKGQLIVFCGDMNYRKLLGDFNCDLEQEFVTCLRGFSPTNLVAIRAIATPIVCGIERDLSHEIANKSKDWLTNREYGVIQFSGLDKCACSHSYVPPDEYFDIFSIPSETCSETFARFKVKTEKKNDNLETRPAKVVKEKTKTINKATQAITNDNIRKRESK